MYLNKSKKINLFDLNFRVYNKLSSKRKRQIIFLLFLLVLSSLAEFFSIASIIPFITVLTNPTKLFDISIIKQIANILGYQNADQLLLPFVLVFMASSAIAGLIKLLNIWLSNKYSAFIGSDFSTKAYQKIISQPLIFFKNKKSSEIINTVIRQSNRTRNFIKFTINICKF